MLIIRLQRVGKKNDPSFRLILTDSKRAAKTGSFLEVLGSYNARVGKPAIKAERVKHWLKHGAQLSGTVHNLLISEKIIEGKKRNVLPKKTVPKVEKEDPKAETAPVTEETSPVSEPAPSPVTAE